MYWLRSNDLFSVFLYALLSLTWAVGGWMICSQLFSLRNRERVLSGLAAGFVLFLTLTNLLAAWIDLSAAAWVSSGLILAAGLGLTWRSNNRPRLDWRDFQAWPQLVSLVALTALFTLIGRGLALFDDYLHLPLISRLAAGDFPPHFYLNTDQYFAYHYALQVWAATMVRMGDMFPWSAWDVSKAFAIALTFLLGYLWIVRRTGARLAGWLGSYGLVVGGGTRWLLLMLPASFLATLSTHVSLINTGANTADDLMAALSQSWVIEGGGKFPFPFAFHNGVFVPIISVLGSTGALPYLTILLILLLVERPDLKKWEACVVTLIMANLAFSAEHLYAFLWGSLALLLVFTIWGKYRKGKTQYSDRTIWIWVAILVGSIGLSAFEGGFITEAIRSLITKWFGLNLGQSSNYYPFSLRWPPAIYSAHLGILSMVDPAQLLVLILELGPVLILAPAATRSAWRAYQLGDWIPASLGLAALVNFIAPIFFQYGVDRSITRLPGTALWLWLLLSIPAGYEWQKVNGKRRSLVLTGLTCICLGGTVIGAVQIANIPYPQLTYYINGIDARFSALYWDQLDPEALVLDRVPYRAVTIFGLGTRTNSSIYENLPGWHALVHRSDPKEIARNGFTYVYIDIDQWEDFSSEQREAYVQPCVILVKELMSSPKDKAWLYDVSGCADSP